MTFVLFVVSFILTSIGLTACGGEAPHRAPPRLELTETSHDAGRVAPGAAIGHRFRFRNAGETELTIDRLRSGCGVSATLVGPNALPAGATGEIAVALDTAQLSDDFRATVTVHSNDPARRTLELVLSGTLDAAVAVDPPTLYAGEISRGARLRQEVALTMRDLGTAIEAVDTDGVPLIVERVGGRIALRVAPAAPLGRFDGELRIHTTNASQPVVRVPVAGIVRPPLVASPPRLELGVDGSGAEGQVLVVNHSGGPVRLTAAEWDPPLGRVEIETLRPGVRYRLRAVPERPLPAAGGTAVLRVRTDLDSQPVLEVPLAWKARTDG